MALAWLAAIILISAADEHNWPQWRGPHGLAVSQESGLPAVWSATENIRWKAPIPGKGHSSPIVWGQKVFLTTSLEGEVVPGAKAVVHFRRQGRTMKSATFSTRESPELFQWPFRRRAHDLFEDRARAKTAARGAAGIVGCGKTSTNADGAAEGMKERPE